MSSTRYELESEQAPGQEPTTFYVQEVTSAQNRTSYVLTEHPENKGPHVSSIASQFGDAKIKEQLSQNPQFKPEDFRLYAERPERGQDGSPRFAEYTAETTRNENRATEPNRFDMKASEWQWRDGFRLDQPDMERRVGATIETSPQSYQNQTAEQQKQEFREASLPETQQADALRQAVLENQQRQKR